MQVRFHQEPSSDLAKPLTTDNAIRVVVSDSSQIVCELLAGALKRAHAFQVVSCAIRVNDVCEAVSDINPDVALISADLADGPYTGFKALRQLRSTNAKTRFVLLTDSTDRDVIIEAFRGGVQGVFPRSGSLQLLCKCIAAVHKGQVWANSAEIHYVLDALQQSRPLKCVNSQGKNLLTRREQEIVPLLAEGLTNKEIAGKLDVSEHTVKNHLFRIYEKLGISSRVELILYAVTQREQMAA